MTWTAMTRAATTRAATTRAATTRAATTRAAIAGLTLGAAIASLAYAAGDAIRINPPPAGSVSAEQGLTAWGRIYEVASHPRCANCHMGDSNRPMWSGPSYGKTRPHGMNISAGDSRMGAETLLCGSCHSQSDYGDAGPHMAPRVGAMWRMPPVEANWFGKSSAHICQQLRDPDRNGGRSFLELAGHLDHDLVLRWAWNPGGGREPAPYSLQEHVDDVLAWGVAGMPCPEN